MKISYSSFDILVVCLFTVFGLNFAWALDDLSNAALVGDKEKLEALIAHGVDVKGEKGGTLMCLAIEGNNKEVVKLLIARGADVNAKNWQGDSLLHLAVKSGNHDILKLLLVSKADVNARNESLQTPIFEAVRFQMPYQGKGGFAPSFSGPDQSQYYKSISPLPIKELIQLLLEYGAEVNIKDRFGETPLHSVTTAEIVELLLARGALINAPRDDGATSLHLAAKDMNADVVKALLEHGANINAKNRFGETPLHIATTEGIVKLLLARDSLIDVRRNDGATPLHLASVFGRNEITKMLLTYGAHVNAKTTDGVTPLHYANGIGIVKLLLANGAEVDASDSGGNTPLYMADKPEVVELLLKHGATLNARNSTGQTPLLRVIRTYISNLPAHGLMSGPLGDDIVVAHGGNIEVIKALLDHGADVNLDDREGCLPLFYVREARKSGAYFEVIDQLKVVENLLLEHGAYLEKRKKKNVIQSQQNFPPELAGIP